MTARSTEYWRATVAGFRTRPQPFTIRCTSSGGHQHLRAVAADTLRLEFEVGGYRWYLGDEALHAGTPVDLLAPDGTWIPGRFEYADRPDGSTAIFYLTLGGWDRPQAALTLPSRAVLRLPHR